VSQASLHIIAHDDVCVLMARDCLDDSLLAALVVESVSPSAVETVVVDAC